MRPGWPCRRGGSTRHDPAPRPSRRAGCGPLPRCASGAHRLGTAAPPRDRLRQSAARGVPRADTEHARLLPSAYARSPCPGRERSALPSETGHPSPDPCRPPESAPRQAASGSSRPPPKAHPHQGGQRGCIGHRLACRDGTAPGCNRSPSAKAAHAPRLTGSPQPASLPARWPPPARLARAEPTYGPPRSRATWSVQSGPRARAWCQRQRMRGRGGSSRPHHIHLHLRRCALSVARAARRLLWQEGRPTRHMEHCCTVPPAQEEAKADLRSMAKVRPRALLMRGCEWSVVS
mmetsp:Transcript_16889/g.55022  ORF Transcript_16889/g.55022 Transcript_16889/m.55022 type:complete len:291 (+) Transcript_16889:529-1401(+)